MFCYECGKLLVIGSVSFDKYETPLHSACLERLEQNWPKHDAYARNLRLILDKEQQERDRLSGR